MSRLSPLLSVAFIVALVITMAGTLRRVQVLRAERELVGERAA